MTDLGRSGPTMWPAVLTCYRDGASHVGIGEFGTMSTHTVILSAVCDDLEAINVVESIEHVVSLFDVPGGFAIEIFDENIHETRSLYEVHGAHSSACRRHLLSLAPDIPLLARRPRYVPSQPYELGDLHFAGRLAVFQPPARVRPNPGFLTTHRSGGGLNRCAQRARRVSLMVSGIRGSCEAGR